MYIFSLLMVLSLLMCEPGVLTRVSPVGAVRPAFDEALECFSAVPAFKAPWPFRMAYPYQVQNGDGSSESWHLIHRPKSTPGSRLIIDYYPMNACSSNSLGLREEDAENVPSELLERGITADQWRSFTKRLAAEVQPQAPCCGGLGCFFATVTLFPLLCWCRQNNNFQSTLSRWVQQLNSELLESHGMFASTQTVVYDAQYDKHHHHEELSWIAIALNSEEVSKLKQEPHIWRFHPACPCCNPCMPSCCPMQNEIHPDGNCCQFACCCCMPRIV